MARLIGRDHYVNDPLDRIEELEAKVAKLERILAGRLDTPTEALAIIDAGSTGATEQGWIEVTVGDVTGYIRIFAAT